LFWDVAAATGQNPTMVYDSKRDVLLLVAGIGGSSGDAAVYALRFTGDGNGAPSVTGNACTLIEPPQARA
jgi:hypothetical protein